MGLSGDEIPLCLVVVQGDALYMPLVARYKSVFGRRRCRTVPLGLLRLYLAARRQLLFGLRFGQMKFLLAHEISRLQTFARVVWVFDLLEESFTCFCLNWIFLFLGFGQTWLQLQTS